MAHVLKKILYVSAAGLVLFSFSCGRDYGRAIIGRWDAGKASLDKTMIVDIQGGGNLTAHITNADMKPVKATYTIEKNRFEIKFPGFSLSYHIIQLDDSVLVMKSKYSKITWKRLK
jgi:hypothetical protein